MGNGNPVVVVYRGREKEAGRRRRNDGKTSGEQALPGARRPRIARTGGAPRAGRKKDATVNQSIHFRSLVRIAPGEVRNQSAVAEDLLSAKGGPFRSRGCGAARRGD
uniref:Uncharacterized protein n=1 Tax=Odontella aurita TaxID=265563 RepID=A0A7S4JS66_9STRA|mmetsp:Transcript_5295/g.15401  ORF Transcript_5295/g.15401 Transcript_5295/m.15401 type:complete len:107 (+) Transcript_5295:302-622(+)